MDASFINKVLPVGAIVSAMLTEAQFQQQCGSEWCLADGRSASGTRYNSITGNANVPDCQGRFIRGRDAAGTTDPDGTVALGTQKDSRNKTHYHELQSLSGASAGSQTVVTSWAGSITASKDASTGSAVAATDGGAVADKAFPIGPSGSADARPMNIIANYFIKIN